ncbi:hypothetical protein F2Q68_00039381 [Brassica cretica]|uniref:Uncharacterized protein n=1 Tax=Brassica cretica TaxID=69181 RepID=A0A8S9MQS4_BRACR|nr:hypothetical protein F2Q68_00039381 [Brassica cretica]
MKKMGLMSPSERSRIRVRVRLALNPEIRGFLMPQLNCRTHGPWCQTLPLSTSGQAVECSPYVTVLWHFYITSLISYSLERFNTGLRRPIPALCLIPICFHVEIPRINEVELGFEGFVEPYPALYAPLMVKEEKLQEGDFEVESLMSFGGSHWCQSTPDHEHRSMVSSPNQSTGSPEHRSMTPTESTASCNAVRILTHEEFAEKHPHPPNPDNVRIARHAATPIDRKTDVDIDRQPPASIDRRAPITYRVQMPKIDFAHLNALRPKPKPSENPPETVRIPSDDGEDSMEVDREKESFRKRVFRIPLDKPFEEAYYTHRLWMLSRETREKEEDIKRMFCEAREKMRKRVTLKKKSDHGQFAIPCTIKVKKPQTTSKRINDPGNIAACHCEAEYETEYSASIETHTVKSIDMGHLKSTDTPHEESVDSSPDDRENDYYNPTIAGYTSTSFLLEKECTIDRHDRLTIDRYSTSSEKPEMSIDRHSQLLIDRRRRRPCARRRLLDWQLGR